MSEQSGGYPTDPLVDALSVPFVPGPKDECVYGGCTADLDALPGGLSGCRNCDFTDGDCRDGLNRLGLPCCLDCDHRRRRG